MLFVKLMFIEIFVSKGRQEKKKGVCKGFKEILFCFA